MTHKRVVFWGSCWPTNIGNAFVNLGAMTALRAALGDGGRVWHAGGMSAYLFDSHGRPDNNLAIADWLEVDFVVMGGMTQCVDHFRGTLPVLESFLAQGARVVIAGGGACDYDVEEVKAVRAYMTELPVHAFISRDTYSYEQYGDLAVHAYDGIDSAFFVPDDFEALPFSTEDFVVLNFDNLPEPSVMRGSKGAAVRVNPDVGERAVVRTHHALIPDRDRDFQSPHTLVSDLPSDYLSLYAAAHTTYSDRIHACIATLAFGNRAQLFGRDVPRLGMFERVGAGDILERPVQIPPERLTAEKQKQVASLREALSVDVAA